MHSHSFQMRYYPFSPCFIHSHHSLVFLFRIRRIWIGKIVHGLVDGLMRQSFASQVLMGDKAVRVVLASDLCASVFDYQHVLVSQLVSVSSLFDAYYKLSWLLRSPTGSYSRLASFVVDARLLFLACDLLFALAHSCGLWEASSWPQLYSLARLLTSKTCPLQVGLRLGEVLRCVRLIDVWPTLHNFASALNEIIPVLSECFLFILLLRYVCNYCVYIIVYKYVCVVLQLFSMHSQINSFLSVTLTLSSDAFSFNPRSSLSAEHPHT